MGVQLPLPLLLPVRLTARRDLLEAAMFAHALFSVAAAVTSKAAVPPPIKSVTRARSSSTMQYQQQGGYFEQQGYGQQQQQGYAHQGYGGQQAGPRVLLYGAQGVVGHDKHIYGREREDYTELPYIVRSLPSRPTPVASRGEHAAALRPAGQRRRRDRPQPLEHDAALLVRVARAVHRPRWEIHRVGVANTQNALRC